MRYCRDLFAMVLIYSASVALAVDQNTPGWFPFIIASQDNSSVPIDVSFLSPKAAGADGFPQIINGHFADGAGNRLRLFGSNITNGAAMPSKTVAPIVAQHLKRLGINVMRFHMMDSSASPNGLLKRNKNGDLTIWDYTMLDRLEFFINELEKNGIYINMGLHTARVYPNTPDNMDYTFRYDKVLDQFYQPFIDDQKAYAQTLLTHLNPYNNKTMANDPGVLCVEITNEDSVFQASLGKLDALPDPFKVALLNLWHAWLNVRYASDEAMRTAWLQGLTPLGPEILTNSDFSSPLTTGWSVQKISPLTATAAIETGVGPDGSDAFHGTVTTPGDVSYAFQLHNGNFIMQNGENYCLAFDAKSPTSSSVNASVGLNASPWTSVGLSTTITLTPSWQHYEYYFTASGVSANCRANLNFGKDLGEWYVDNVTLKKGDPPSVFTQVNSQTRDNAVIPITNASTMQVVDFNLFLYDTEKATAMQMKTFLKTTLGVKAFISDTQAAYGGFRSSYREAEVADYVDNHAYWQHPSFPNTPWDPIDWKITNTPLSSSGDGGTMRDLAQERVWGMPYSISEYNHPAPSFYQSEMYPIYASFGSFQDWDAIYQFPYRNDASTWDQQKLDGYFTMDGNPNLLAFCPLAAYIFRTGCFTTTQEPALIRLPDSSQTYLSAANNTNIDSVWTGKGMKNVLPMLCPLGIQFASGVTTPALQLPTNINQSAGTSPNKLIDWQMGTDGTYKGVSPNAVVMTGAVAGTSTPLTLGPFQIAFTPTTNGHAAFMAVALDGNPLTTSQKIAFALMNRTENSNMVWNDTFTSVGNQWGTTPTVCDRVAATITFAGTAAPKIASLDGGGHPKTRIIPVISGGSMTFDVGAQDSVWYVMQGDNTAAKDLLWGALR